MKVDSKIFLYTICLVGLTVSTAVVYAEAKAPKIYSENKSALLPAPKIISEQQENLLTRDKCLMARPAFGDLGNYWSVGATASTQAVKYTFGTHQASSAASAGIGVAFRFYANLPLAPETPPRLWALKRKT